MNAHPHSPSPHDPQVIVVEVSESNGAGFWGFILSVLGVTCCVGSCFSWVGLIVSLIGLGKKPRGFAIAGVVLGLVGTTGGVLFWKTVGTSHVLPIVKIARTLGLVELPTFMAMREAEQLVLKEFEKSGTLPSTFGELTGGVLSYEDQWGTEITYRVNGGSDGYSLHSAGADTAWGTGDELSYTVLDANKPEDFIVSHGTISLLDATAPLYTPEQIENAPVPGEVSADDGG